jgi:hypothetical protein
MDGEEDEAPAAADLALKTRLDPYSTKLNIGKQPTPTMYRGVAGTSPPPHSTGSAGELGIGLGRRASRATQLQ